MPNPTNPINVSRLTRTTRRGAVLVVLAIFLPVCLIMCAFAINVAYLELNRTELQITTDAAARAGGRDLLVLQSKFAALLRAESMSLLNKVGGQPLILMPGDLVFGTATRPSATARYTFTPGTPTYNALQVTGHRDSGSINGQLNVLLPAWTTNKKFSTTQSAQATEGDIDIVLVVDRSGSMAYSASETTNPPSGPPAAAPVGWTWGQPCPPNARWLDLVAGVQVFVSDLTASASQEMLALVSYNNSTVIDCPISSTYTGIAPALDVYSQSFPMGSTATGDGILDGINALANSNARPWAAKVMIVMTDGLTNTGSDPLWAAQQAADQNIMIFTITYSDEADQTAMTQVAAIGAGIHYHATNSTDLNTVFKDIAKQLPTLLCK